jgi:hypothetical protein
VWFTAGHTSESRDVLAVDMRGRQRLVYASAGIISLLDIAPDGRLLLHRSVDRQGVMARGPGQSVERDLSVFNSSAVGSLSADSGVLVVNEDGGPAGAGGAVYLRALGGGDPIRLVEGIGSDLSADGKSVLVVSGTPRRLFEVPTGPGFSRPMDLGGITPAGIRAQWVPPHRDRVAFWGHQGSGRVRLWVASSSGGTPRALTPEIAGTRFAVSRDGRSVALSLTPGTISIIPIEGGHAREIPGIPRHLTVGRWSGDGRSLFLLNDGNWPCQVHRLNLATGQLKLWQQVAPSDPTGIIFCSLIVPSEDGRSYAYTYLRCMTDIVLAEGLR